MSLGRDTKSRGTGSDILSIRRLAEHAQPMGTISNPVRRCLSYRRRRTPLIRGRWKRRKNGGACLTRANDRVISSFFLVLNIRKSKRTPHDDTSKISCIPATRKSNSILRQSSGQGVYEALQKVAIPFRIGICNLSG